jgi:serine/threonine protein phosphatase PrpC
VIIDALAASEIGARHRRLGEEREDASGWFHTGPPDVLTAAVADGHGDPRCPRSRDGARFAVACAPEAASAWHTDPSVASERQDLAARFVRRWQAAVDHDLVRRPAPDDSSRSPGASARLLYGTTALLAVLTDTGITILRIGDGDAVGVDRDGVAYRLLDPLRTAVPGETSSLSADDAERLARCRTLARTEAPALVVLVTDGVADAYSDDDGLLSACAELYDVWQQEGRARAQASVSMWLQAAASYSGDDASAAAIRVWPDS